MVVWGEGEPVVLVHGSFGWGEETWREQQPLASNYRLILLDRRGFGGSPPDGRVDFERDAADVADLLGDGAHLLGHSYGGVVSLLAASRRPEAVRSLVVIEPPALALARGHEAVEQLISGIEHAVMTARDGVDYRSRFLRAFGFSGEPEPLDDVRLRAAEASWRERPPWEAEIPLEILAATRFPKLVVRGAWDAAPEQARKVARRSFHAVCDVLEERLQADAVSFAGAAHRPQELGEPFNERVRSFWEAA
jgi:pimeloyl-ACP methyl ester carboxylesterase